MYWTARIIGRSQWLLYKCSSPWQKLWKAKALIGYSVSTYSVVCLCVCPQATGHSFWPRNLISWHNTPWDMRKKCNFSFFEILIFGPLRALFRPFSSMFFFILCKSSVRATSHTDRLTNLIFCTASLYGTRTFNQSWKFAFLTLLGALIFSKRALKANRHDCGHRNIISWYAGSMWHMNVGTKYYVWKFWILMSLGAL